MPSFSTAGAQLVAGGAGHGKVGQRDLAAEPEPDPVAPARRGQLIGGPGRVGADEDPRSVGCARPYRLGRGGQRQLQLRDVVGGSVAARCPAEAARPSPPRRRPPAGPRSPATVEPERLLPRGRRVLLLMRHHDGRVQVDVQPAAGQVGAGPRCRRACCARPIRLGLAQSSAWRWSMTQRGSGHPSRIRLGYGFDFAVSFGVII